MNLPHPEVFHAALRSERLEVIANILIEEHFSTMTDLQSEYDDGYSRGTTRFARQKNRLKSVALSGQYDWLQLRHGANDLVFTIDGIPCRFATDDPVNPTKPAVVDATPIQLSFFDEVENGAPCKFCFILDGGYTEAEDPRVVFLGEDMMGDVKCKWSSDGGAKALHAISANTPPAKDVGKAPVGPKRIDSGKTGTSEAP